MTLHHDEQSKWNMYKKMIKIDVLYKPIGSSGKYKCIFLPFYIQIRDQNICFQQQTK